MNTSTNSASPNILIVDDVPANLRLLAQIITGNGYQARPVLSGAEALAVAACLPPDLVILDIRMPDMDGYEVCRRLKAVPATRDAPVVFISALGDADDKMQAFAVGGVDYVTKPFQAAEVIARVRTHLHLRELQQQLEMQVRERDRLVADLRAYAHTVAHDLRNPLAGAVGCVDMLRSEDDTLSAEERDFYLAGLDQSLHVMDTIIAELLLLAEVSNMTSQANPLAMAAIVAAAWQRIGGQEGAADATLLLPEKWPAALGYAPWIEQVWVNYLANAVKYGGRPLHIELGAEMESDGQARFWVHDNGIGLTPAQQSRLFVPFARLSETPAVGHGLGLSIVERIIAKLGGRVGVASEGLPGHGCTFYFTLPSAPPSRQ